MINCANWNCTIKIVSTKKIWSNCLFNYKIKYFFRLGNLLLKWKFKNNQQCCQGSKMLCDDLYLFPTSVPSLSTQHPGLHAEVDRGCLDWHLMMIVLQSKQLLHSGLQPFEEAKFQMAVQDLFATRWNLHPESWESWCWWCKIDDFTSVNVWEISTADKEFGKTFNKKAFKVSFFYVKFG